MTTGGRIRERREALGLSREQVAERTRIPLAQVEAVEEDRRDRVPPGPYWAAYVRTIESLLGLEPSEAEPELTHPLARAGLPLGTVRLLAAFSVAFALGLTALGFLRSPEVVTQWLPDPPEADPRDQRVELRARRTVQVRARQDGQLVFDGPLVGGQALDLAAKDRVELLVDSVGAVSIQYNGQSIVPLSDQRKPRTLVFVDDLQPGPP
jgi:transcriptional regulator with XRE-family HTH domain